MLAFGGGEGLDESVWENAFHLKQLQKTLWGEPGSNTG